jgi:hypothetical protein
MAAQSSIGTIATHVGSRRTIPAIIDFPPELLRPNSLKPSGECPEGQHHGRRSGRASHTIIISEGSRGRCAKCHLGRCRTLRLAGLPRPTGHSPRQAPYRESRRRPFPTGAQRAIPHARPLRSIEPWTELFRIRTDLDNEIRPKASGIVKVCSEFVSRAACLIEDIGFVWAKPVDGHS